MGSSTEKKKVGQALRARKAAKRLGAGQGGAGGGIGGSEGDMPQTLIVALVRIDRAVHSRSSVGDRVRVGERGSGLSVFTSAGRIGDIPPGYVEKVRTANYAAGAISQLQADPIGVTVSLH